MTETQQKQNDSSTVQQVFGNVERVNGIKQNTVMSDTVTYRNLTEKVYGNFSDRQSVRVYEFVTIQDLDFEEDVWIIYHAEPADECDEELLTRGMLEEEEIRVDNLEEAREVVEEFVSTSR